MAQYGWGIDCGDGTLKAVRLKAEGRYLKIVQVEEIPYLDPFLKKKSGGASLDRRAVAALIQFGNSVDISDLDRVAMSFPSFTAKEGVLELPRVEESQREEMVRFELSSLLNHPEEVLNIRHEHHSFPSADMEKIRYHIARRDEYENFLHHLAKAEIPYDRIVSPGAAMADMAKLLTNTGSPGFLVSPGFNATTLTLFNRSDYFTRVLPLGLPAGPGREMEISKVLLNEMCDLLKREIDVFLEKVLSKGKIKLSKILITGEGACIPAVVNAMDARMDLAVEVLQPSARLMVDETRQLPYPKGHLYSMSKALGLAAGVLDRTSTGCQLSAPSPRRQSLRRLPALTWASALILLLVLGFWGLKTMESSQMDGFESRMEEMSPKVQAEAVEQMQDRVDNLRFHVNCLKNAESARRNFRGLIQYLMGFENPSVRGTVGDYHLTYLSLDLGEERRALAQVASRMSDSDGVKGELLKSFKLLCPDPAVEGPLPAMEETPPEGMSPMAIYKLEGELR